MYCTIMYCTCIYVLLWYEKTSYDTQYAILLVSYLYLLFSL